MRLKNNNLDIQRTMSIKLIEDKVISCVMLFQRILTALSVFNREAEQSKDQIHVFVYLS